ASSSFSLLCLPVLSCSLPNSGSPDSYTLSLHDALPISEQSVRFQTALASIKLIQASAVLDLTEDDFDFLTSNKVWIATDRSRARRCVEACVYGTLDKHESGQ